MGTVYRATQLSLNRPVALKLLASELSDDPGFRVRFQREGQLQAALDHQHIVTVYEAGETEDGLFLAMRLISGPTLKELILGRQLTARRSLRLLAQVARALDTAHAAGLIHRDIKPQNILIGAGDHAYLADFGLIKAPDEGANLTGPGQFVGTIDYVAPEQLRDEPVTAASDLYALTAVLYECLTGQVPFPRANEAAALHAHLTAPPPRATEQRPELPAAIDEVIAQGMSKDPAARPKSAAELLGAATRALTGGGATVARAVERDPSPTSARSSDTRVGPAAALTVASAGAGATVLAGVGTMPVEPPEVAQVGGAIARRTGPAEARRRARGWSAATGIVAVLLVAAAIAGGFAIGRSSAGHGGNSLSFTNLVTVGHVQLRYPASWQLRSVPPALPGVVFSDPLALASGLGNGGLTAGEVAAAGGPTLLTAPFRELVEGHLPAGEPVGLGGFEAYRYAGLRVRGLAAPVTVYVVATSAGVATIACLQATEVAPGFQAKCAQVAATLRLFGVSAYPLGPSAAYARGLSAAFDRLRAGVSGPLAALTAATAPTAQASALGRLSAAYARARTDLGAIISSPALRDAQSALIAALGTIESGYARAASSARSGNAAAYASADRTLSAGEASLSKALTGLASMGYQVRR